jgi:hypothetical protein
MFGTMNDRNNQLINFDLHLIQGFDGWRCARYLQKTDQALHLVDLAAYIDKRRAAAVKECSQLCGTT